MPLEPVINDFDPQRPFSYVEVLRGALFNPREFFLSIPRTGLWPPLAFLLVTHLFNLLVFWLAGLVGLTALPGKNPWSLVAGFIQGLAMAGIVFLLARYVLRTGLGFPAALRIYAYTGGVWVLSFITVLMPSTAAGVFWAVLALVQLYLMLIALQQAGGMSMPVAAACLIMTVVAMLLLNALAGAWSAGPAV